MFTPLPFPSKHFILCSSLRKDNEVVAVLAQQLLELLRSPPPYPPLTAPLAVAVCIFIGRTRALATQPEDQVRAMKALLTEIGVGKLFIRMRELVHELLFDSVEIVEPTSSMVTSESNLTASDDDESAEREKRWANANNMLNIGNVANAKKCSLTFQVGGGGFTVEQAIAVTSLFPRFSHTWQVHTVKLL
jgi:hypothetical protein